MVFVADQLEVGEHSREQDMRQGWFPGHELENVIRSGIITDDSTIAAYLLYQLSERNRNVDQQPLFGPDEPDGQA